MYLPRENKPKSKCREGKSQNEILVSKVAQIPGWIRRNQWDIDGDSKVEQPAAGKIEIRQQDVEVTFTFGLKQHVTHKFRQKEDRFNEAETQSIGRARNQGREADEQEKQPTQKSD